MNIIEVKLKKGKIKKDVIVISINSEDFKNLDENVLTGEFYRGKVFVVREDKEDEFIQQMQEDY